LGPAPRTDRSRFTLNSCRIHVKRMEYGARVGRELRFPMQGRHKFASRNCYSW
jgi:hypothetical protein